MTDFKVGDEVEVLENGVEVPVGTKGIVENPRNNAGFVVLDGIGWRLFLPSELKRVKPEPKFKAGDIVKSIGFQYRAFKDKTLIVEGLSERKNWDYKVRALGEDWKEGYEFREDELVPGEELAEWEIELLDSGRPSFKKAFVEQLEANAKVSELIHDNAKPEAEAVDGPAHYGGKDNPYEVIKVAEAWGFNENAYLFNALKYLGRAGKKGSKVEDLKKLVFYVEREIALEEAK